MSTMQIARYSLAGCVHHGILEGDRLRRLQGSPLEQLAETSVRDALAEVTLLCPVERPRIFGAAYNYKAHTQESGRNEPTLPVLFMKPGTAATGHQQPIVYPEGGEIVHYEGELTVIIGKTARYVSEREALNCVFGYTCGNDVSDRVVQRQESSFGCLLAGKAYDTFAPLGPVVTTGLDPAGLTITTRLNGAVKQHGKTSDLVYSVPALIAYLSRFITLLPGDVVMTGTPAGVGPIQVGDVVEVEIPGIGVLSNPVVAESIPR
jgi:2-keto-4-pentenoate hydratase/2-oxohepta-3-ene-1,7-dioic acid hydratase in catechol pathway